MSFPLARIGDVWKGRSFALSGLARRGWRWDFCDVQLPVLRDA